MNIHYLESSKTHFTVMLIGIVSIYQHDFTNVNKMFNLVKTEYAVFAFQNSLVSNSRQMK